MSMIRVAEIKAILKKMNKTPSFFKAKLEAAGLVKDYVDGVRNLEENFLAVSAFYQLVKVLDSGTLKDDAMNKLETEHPTIIGAEKSKVFKFLRKRSESPDEIELKFSRESLKIYRQMGLVSKKNYEKFIGSDLHEIDEFLATVELKTKKQQLRFAEIFVKNHRNNLEIVPPVILARAHEALKEKVDSGARGTDKDLLNAILVRIDDMSSQFATFENIENFRPSSKNQKLSNYADMTNIASVYEGYRSIFEQRLTWLSKNTDSLLAKELRRNIKNIDAVMDKYDGEWNLRDFNSDEKSVEQRYEDLKISAKGWNVSDDVKQKTGKYVFADKSKQNEYLNQIIELVRHEIVLKNIVSDKAIDDKQLETDFNNAILLKLSDMAKDGDYNISDKAYNRAKLDFVNQTADFAGRLNSKFESAGEKIKTDLLPDLFTPLKEIDERSNARFHNEKPDAYKAKVDFFKRIFKTFASSFLTSAAITGIAMGVAALAGASLATGIAVVGVTSGIALSYFQIKKWQKNQIALGKGCGFKDLIADKRMLFSLGTTGVAAIGMIFGAAGLTAVMAGLGYTSIAVGGVSNSVQIFNDAKSSGLNNAWAAALAVGTVLAAAAGGIAGRGLVKSFANVDTTINTNDDNQTSKNEVAQEQVVEVKEESRSIEQTYHEETKISCTQSGLDNAKRIAGIFYQDDMAQLQKHVEMVEQYNATHGTNIDPYRAAILRADAGGHVPSNYAIAIDDNGATRFTNGNVKMFGPGWLKSHPEFTADDIKELANVFNGDTPSEAGMKVMEKLELSEIVSEKNHVGTVSVPTKSVNGFNSYSNGTPAIMKEVVMVPDEFIKPDVSVQPVAEPVIEPVAEPASVPTKETVNGGMGMFGIFSAKKRGGLKRLRERMGTFLDSVLIQKERAA